MDKKRVWGTVTDETMNKINVWSDRLGLHKSQFVNMCIQAGIGSIIRAVAPEEALSPDQWSEIIKRVNAEGKENEGDQAGRK